MKEILVHFKTNRGKNEVGRSEEGEITMPGCDQRMKGECYGL